MATMNVIVTHGLGIIPFIIAAIAAAVGGASGGSSGGSAGSGTSSSSFPTGKLLQTLKSELRAALDAVFGAASKAPVVEAIRGSMEQQHRDLYAHIIRIVGGAASSLVPRGEISDVVADILLNGIAENVAALIKGGPFTEADVKKAFADAVKDTQEILLRLYRNKLHREETEPCQELEDAIDADWGRVLRKGSRPVATPIKMSNALGQIERGSILPCRACYPSGQVVVKAVKKDVVLDPAIASKTCSSPAEAESYLPAEKQRAIDVWLQGCTDAALVQRFNHARKGVNMPGEALRLANACEVGNEAVRALLDHLEPRTQMMEDLSRSAVPFAQRLADQLGLGITIPTPPPSVPTPAPTTPPASAAPATTPTTTATSTTPPKKGFLATVGSGLKAAWDVIWN